MMDKAGMGIGSLEVMALCCGLPIYPGNDS